MRLSFDNSEGFANLHFVTQLCEMNMPITSSDLFRLFPFHMVLSRYAMSLNIKLMIRYSEKIENKFTP